MHTIKGYKLDYSAALVINFQSMKQALYFWINNYTMELNTFEIELLRNKHKVKGITDMLGDIIVMSMIR